MTLRFRHLDFNSDAEPDLDAWPAEAIETLLDRGTLSDWCALAGMIRRNPWGTAARTAENVASWGEHYGVDRLILEVIKRARAEADIDARRHYAAQIREWRAATGMTFRQFAGLAGTSASRLSDYEHAKVAPTTDVLGPLRRVALQSALTPDETASSSR